ncbi:hypothetical protein BC835DRAFT_1419815 [Cytidiella melzeri]|nr:hypothetical protein BC835DRAFT_1419815 [Cytidiella melzeri]
MGAVYSVAIRYSPFQYSQSQVQNEAVRRQRQWLELIAKSLSQPWGASNVSLSNTDCSEAVQSSTAGTLPAYEYILSVAAENLDNEAVLVLHEKGSQDEPELTLIKWRHILTAVHSRATELVRSTGLSARALGDAPFTVGLLGNNGYQYLVTWLAILMLRWTPILISPQNSSEAVLHLLTSTNATYLLLDNTLEARYKDLPTETLKLTVLPAFDLANLHEDHPEKIAALLRYVDSFKRGESADALRKESQNTCMYMHTSGSTGHPKAIAWSHQFVNNKTKQAGEEYPHEKGRLVYTPLPIYHGGGFSMCLPVIAGYGGIITLVEPYQVVSSDSVLRHLRILRNKEPTVLLVPNLLEDIVDTMELSQALEYLRIPNTVLQGGAPLRRDVGDKLAHGGIHLVTWGGITEAGVFASQEFDPTRNPSDWQYIKLSTSFEFHFTPLDEEHPDQGYRLVMSPKSLAPPVINHENPRGFLVPDIWMKHPDPNRSDLWRIAGRFDDIIVLSNGEKANGKQLETSLCASPFISQAVIFGSGRFLCGALLRPSAEHRFSVGDEQAKAAYLEQVWSFIETVVNNTVPRHSRLLRPLVLVEDPSKPFQFSDKSTIKNKATLDLYLEEINQAYRTVEEGEPSSIDISHSTSPAFTGIVAVTELVRTLVSETLGRDVGDEDDFFNSGLDSLLAVRLRFAVISALKDSEVSEEVPRNVIYTHPSTASLARYLWSLIDRSRQVDMNTSSVQPWLDEASIANMVDETVSRLTASFPDRPLTSFSNQGGDVYVVTGTTGSLGSAFLSVLLQQPIDTVKKVYMLNRTSNKATMMQRHRKSFVEKGLDFAGLEAAITSGRAVLVETDVTKEKIGISAEVYAEMAAQATHIVHNAWPVTFTYQFQSFRPQLDGLRVLIDLALTSPRPVPPHFTFISSISVAGRLASSSSNTVIPELALSSVANAFPHGYAQSKFAAEKILEKATSATALRASIVRSGQIAGSLITGAWNRHEYIPSILRASVRSGKMPNDLFSKPLHWFPVEHASKALYALTQSSASSSAPLTFYGFENIRPIYWTSIMSSLLTLYPSLREVSTTEWFHSVRSLQEAKEGSHQNVIDTTLLDYIEEFVRRKPLPRLVTDNLRGVSPEVAQLVDFDYTGNEAVVENYIRYAVGKQ